jgi:hypothetical protein
MYKKIDVYINGKYEYSTNAYKTCKDAINNTRQKKTIFVAGKQLIGKSNYIEINNTDKIQANFSKN